MFIKQRIAKNGLVTLADVDFFGLSEEDGGKWVLMCEVHKVFIQDTNKARLWQHNNESENWCEECLSELAELNFKKKLAEIDATVQSQMEKVGA
jgi:hypothetical protein